MKIKSLFLFTSLLFLAGCSSLFFRPSESAIPQATPPSPEQKDIEVVAEKLDIPWEVAFVAENKILVTERGGRLIKLGEDRTVIEIEGVEHRGEGGLQGMALDPDFKENQLLYLYLTTKKGNKLENRVERYRLEGDHLTARTILFEGIPGAVYHDGGRIEFGPDGLLYITTGDATDSHLAQNKSSLAGKILRINADGTIPEDNPFGNAVYSYGHRNVQGLAWDDEGRLWITEHGRSGVLSGFDEINLIQKGANYGWPNIQGDEAKEGMQTPIVHSGPDETWAPAGMEYVNGSLFFAGLRGETLYEAEIIGNGQVELRAHLRGEFGRLRAVRLGPDGYLYLTTSNRDGRGQVKTGDDKLIRVSPASLE